MLLSDIDHGKLLPIPWIQIDAGVDKHHMDGRLYIKALFDRTEYRILVTDLRYVWYEFGDVTSITKRATSYRLDIESEDQIVSLITSLKQCFQQPKSCVFHLSNGGQMVIEYKDASKGFVSLSWSFYCLLLESAILDENHAYLDGPTVLYKHFILPMVMMTESNWPNQMVDKDETRSPYLDDTNHDDESEQNQDWLTQLSMVTELVPDEDLIANDEQEDEQLQESPVKHESSSSPTKKLTDPEKELERRSRLEADLMKKRGLKKKKRRLF